PGCLAAAAAELSPTSQLGLGVVSSSLLPRLRISLGNLSSAGSEWCRWRNR
ncbi:hypothetical protein Tco_0549700, partial [Tanacetum coccineum]